MVSLVGGEWAEVRTLAIGTVEERATKQGERVPHCTDLSYFCRLTDATTFTRSAVLETHRRGTARVEAVCAVMDGAEWLQRFIDLHRSDAVRILDFPHAAEYLAKAAHAAFGAGTEQATWLAEQHRILKEEAPDQVLEALGALPLEGEAAEVRDGVVHYLAERRSQIAYAQLRAQGYSIGSGIVESGNKLVIGARLKGSRVPSGCHWARGNVNPMVALRTVACSGRWSSAWVSIGQQRRAELARQRREQIQRRREERHDRVREQARPPVAAPAPAEPAAGGSHQHVARPKQVLDGRPTADHPWRSFRLSRRRSA
jgi:hypothetical protein